MSEKRSPLTNLCASTAKRYWASNLTSAGAEASPAPNVMRVFVGLMKKSQAWCYAYRNFKNEAGLDDHTNEEVRQDRHRHAPHFRQAPGPEAFLVLE